MGGNACVARDGAVGVGVGGQQHAAERRGRGRAVTHHCGMDTVSRWNRPVAHQLLLVSPDSGDHAQDSEAGSGSLQQVGFGFLLGRGVTCCNSPGPWSQLCLGIKGRAPHRPVVCHLSRSGTGTFCPFCVKHTATQNSPALGFSPSMARTLLGLQGWGGLVTCWRAVVHLSWTRRCFLCLPVSENSSPLVLSVNY